MKIKIALVTILMTAMLVMPAFAVNEWYNNLYTVVEPPIQPEPPGTGSGCQAYSTKEIRCGGNFKFYQQCIMDMQGGHWEQRSENCLLHGVGWTCQNSECIYTGTTNGGNFDLQALITQYWWLLVIVVVIVLWKEKKIKF